MKYIIENNSGWDKAFKVFGGTYVVKNGKTETVDVEGGLTDAKIEEHKSKGVTIVQEGAETPTDDNAPLGYDGGDQLSEDQLRTIIEEKTGKKPRSDMKYQTLVEKYNELNDAEAGQ